MESLPDYHLLERASQQIRLLRILLDHDKAPLETHFEVYALDQTPRYHALSYTWGEGQASDSITVDGKTVHIYANAHAFLRSMRLMYGECLVWMDCLCINQRADAEKSHQVELMGDIYRKAGVVHAWLGLATRDSRLVFDTALELRLSRKTPSHRAFHPWGNMMLDGGLYWQRAARCEIRPAIRALLLRSYWTRVWILQELILATDVIYMCGSDIMPFEDLSELCRVYSMGGAYLEDTAYSKGWNTLDKVAQFRSERRPPWRTSFLFFLRNDCSNPRDKVYAFRQMMEASQNSLPVDYKKSVLDVYMDMLRTGLLSDPEGIRSAGRLLTSMRESNSSLARSAKVMMPKDFAPIRVSRSFRVVASDHSLQSSEAFRLYVSFGDLGLSPSEWNMCRVAPAACVTVNDIVVYFELSSSMPERHVILVLKEKHPGKFTTKTVVDSRKTNDVGWNHDLTRSHCSVTTAPWDGQIIEIDRLTVSIVLYHSE